MTYSVEITGTGTTLPDYETARAPFVKLGLNPTPAGDYHGVSWTDGEAVASDAPMPWRIYVSGSKDHDWQAEQGLVKAAAISAFVFTREAGATKAVCGSVVAAQVVGEGRNETILFG